MKSDQNLRSVRIVGAYFDAVMGDMIGGGEEETGGGAISKKKWCSDL